ncbi:MAG: hypothetical protein JW734_08570 [Candidatus Omnitrophica bacterium]|nr:hypothetical protein [Candidatus Omnitrophota bacterium]
MKPRGKKLFTRDMFLRLRILIFLLPLYFLFDVFANYSYYANFTGGGGFQYVFYECRLKYPIINDIAEKTILFFDGRFSLLGQAFLSAALPLAAIYGMRFIWGYSRRKTSDKTLVFLGWFFAIAGILLFHGIFYLSLSVDRALGIAFFVMFVYLFDFSFFEDKEMSLDIPINRRVMKTVFLFLPGLAEFLFLPLYLALAGWAKNYHKNKLFNFVKYMHFSLICFSVFVIVTPLKAGTVKNIITEDITKGTDTYGLKIGDDGKRLFVLSKYPSGLVSVNVEDENQISSERIYPKEPRNVFLAEVFDIGQQREEIYLIDRGRKELIILDFNDYSIKGSIYSGGFNNGDSRSEYAEGFVYVINDNAYYLYKIDPAASKIALQVPFEKMTIALEYNRVKDVLYTMEWCDNEVLEKSASRYKIKPLCFLYEIDASSLQIKRQIAVEGGCWEIVASKDGSKLFCALPFAGPFRSYVYVIDADRFEVIDKIKVPLGTRAIALDDERNLLFAGSAATNFIDIIDLNTKKVLKTLRAGPFSLRAIVLDKERRYFYASTRHFGVLRGKY